MLVRGSVHAHAYALALKKITGVDIEKMLPTPNIPLSKIPECQKYLDEGSHRRLYTFSLDDYTEMAGIWGNGEMALPTDPPGQLKVIDGMPEGGKIHQLLPLHQIMHLRKCSKSPRTSTEEPLEARVTKLFGCDISKRR